MKRARSSFELDSQDAVAWGRGGSSTGDLVLDVEVGGIGSGRGRVGSRGSQRQGNLFVDGPKTLDDMMSWPAAGLAALHRTDCTMGTQLMMRFCKTFERGIVITTSYSGMGTAEAAVSMLSAEVASSLDCPKRVVIQSACDSSDVSQRCLVAHGSASRAKHIFTDVLDVLYEDDKVYLLKMQEDILSAADDNDKEDINAARKQKGIRLRRAIIAALKKIKFRPDAYCTLHKQRCVIDAREEDPELAGSLHVEIAGNTCTPWSTAGVRHGWCHRCTLPCLVWAMTQKRLGKDVIINECTPTWEAEVLDAEIFQDLAMPNAKKYTFHSFCFNATSMGIPASRDRKWSLWLRKPSEPPLPPFGDIFFRRLMCSSATFLVATEEMIQEDLLCRAKNALHLDKESIEALQIRDIKSVLAPGDLARLQDWIAEAVRRNLVWTTDSGKLESNLSSVMVDMSQNVGFSSIGVDVSIPLKRSAELFDLIQDRPCHILECMLMHGFPMPGLVAQQHSRHFPFPELLAGGSGTRREWKSLCGNGMLVQVVGAMILYALVM